MRRRALLGASAALLAHPADAAPFSREPHDLQRPPRLRVIDLPAFPGANAIWGATGTDARGSIWAGISALGGENSAHLVEYDPTTSRRRDRGDVLSELARLGLRQPEDSQTKIHTKPVQAGDGWLYFASTDETGETNQTPSRWGSHLWRLRPGEGRWDHVQAVPEGLIALAGPSTGQGRWLYALGLWNHVLYAHDTSTRQTHRTEVGAPPGHMSRNLVVDRAGHAYVPRVTLGAAGLEATLVEYTPRLDIVSETPLAAYADSPNPAASAGIAAFAELADGALIIATGIGYLYRITPRAGGASVVPLGWLHPGGTAYTPALFTWDGVHHLAGLARLADGDWSWVVYDLAARLGTAQPFPHGETERPLLLYGSMTHDTQGRFYLAGRRRRGETRQPLLLQVDTL